MLVSLFSGVCCTVSVISATATNNGCRTFRSMTWRSPSRSRLPSPPQPITLKHPAARLRLFEASSFPAPAAPSSFVSPLFPPQGETVIHVALPLISCNTAFISAAAIASIFSRRLSHLASALLSRRRRPLRLSSLARLRGGAALSLLLPSFFPPPPRHLDPLAALCWRVPGTFLSSLFSDGRRFPLEGRRQRLSFPRCLKSINQQRRTSGNVQRVNGC